MTLPSSDGVGEENSEAAGATFFVTVAQLVAYLGPEFKSYISEMILKSDMEQK